MTKFLFMLTHHDVTVANAVEVFEEVRNTDPECVGFKDIGLGVFQKENRPPKRLPH